MLYSSLLLLQSSSQVVTKSPILLVVPKSKEMWIVHIDISCNITTNTKRINQIPKNQIFANNIYLHILETFSELSPLFVFV